MHLPLLLSCDTVLQKRKPWPNLHWIGEDTRKVYQIARHLVGEVDLHTGSSYRVSQLCSITKVAAAVNYTYNGTYVYGIMTSGDIFFWNQKLKNLSQARGIPDLVTHIPHSANRDSVDGPLQSVLDLLKRLRPQNLGGSGATENAHSTHSCSVPSHHKPNIFASNDCSKVVVVLGASQIHLWERDLVQPLDGKGSSIISGHWSVVVCPTDVPLPTLQSRETQVSSCFLVEASLGNKCHITFSFIGASCLVITTLTLQWGSSGNAIAAGGVLSAYWNSISVSHQAMGMRETEMLQKRGTLISRYAHGQSLVSIAVNSCQQQRSKLLYLHPYCNTAVVVSVCDAVYQEDLHNANNSKSHWVSDLTWSRDNTYVVGCLRSGAVFVATRMGPLVKISCTGKNLELQPATILPLHPLYDSLSKEVNNEETSLSSESFAPTRPTFCVSCHPLRDQLLLSSGLRVSVLALPENGRRDAEVVDQLLTAAKHALYLLQNSSLTHDYAYIHCSTWKLAQSVLDLSKNFSKSASIERCEISLWDKKNLIHEECNTHTDNHADEGGRLIEQVMKPLLAAWTLISSHRGPQTNDWKGKPMHVAKQLVKLVSILMQTSLNDDYSEHQAMLLQILHIFHHFVKVLAVWPKSFHMVKPTYWLTHQIIHTFLRCEKHAGESSMVDTLLILTQTLCSVECTLTQVYEFRPVLQIPSQLMYSIVGEAPGIEVTNFTAISSMTFRGGTCESDPAVCLRMKKLWVCLHLNSKKVYLRLGEKKFEQRVYQKLLTVMNIIQSRLQRLGFDLGKKKVRLDKCDQLYLNGIHLAAVKDWKFKIIKSLPCKRDRGKIGRYLHSVLYAYLLHKDFIGITDFLSWLYYLLKSNICTKNQSSLPNNALSSTPKPKKDSHVPPQEVLLDISHITEETIKTCTQEAAEVSGGFVSQQTANKIAEQCESFAVIKDNRDTTSQKCNHSVGGLQNTSSLIRVVRQVIGSLGRIMAEVILQHDIDIPSPHSPHIIPPIWDHSSKLRDRGITPFCPTLMKDAIHTAHWSSETAAQALAIAGYWYDITALSQGLGDTKTALISSLIADTIEKSRIPTSSRLHPSTIIKDLVLQSGPMENLKASVFHSHQELMQVASMSCLEVIPNILQECLEKIQEVMQHFEVYVPSDVYLPAPPVFCPQVTSGMNDVLQSSDDIRRYDERILRKELAGWVRLFCSVVSAAGIAQPLLLEICHTCHRELRKVSGEYNEELDILAETLGPVQFDWTPHGSEWSRIIELWQKFLSQLWILHARDKLSLCLRKFTVDTSSLYQRKVSQGTDAVDILSWVQELYKVTDVDTWKDELISTALTAASNAPPNPVVAQVLANIIPRPANLPSLLKDKAARLFEHWKNTDVVITEVREKSLEIKGKSGRHKSLIETCAKLYDIYDKKCAELMVKCNFHKGDQRDIPSDNCTSYYNETTSETVGEEFRNFGFLFASMTFARDAEMFPQHFAQIPQLVQFSDVVKKREFQGLRIKSQIFQSEHNSYAEHVDQNVLDYTNHMSVLNVTSGLVSPGKKGLFRNLAHSKINEGGVKTVFHFHDQTFLATKRSGRKSNRNHSLSPLHKKHIVNQRNQSSHRTEETDSSSSYLKPEHFACRRLQYKNSRPCSSESRSRSHSSSTRERGTSSSFIQNRRSRSTGSTWFQKKSKSRLLDLNDTVTSSMNQNHPLNLLLYLSKFHRCGIENEVFQEVTRLVQWLMSSERKLCPPSTTIMRIDEHCTIKKVNLSLEDIVLALSWEYLSPCKFHNTHPKKAVIPFEHRKKPSAEIMEVEVLKDKDVKGKQNHKQKFTVKHRVSPHNAVITDIKVKDHEQDYTSIIVPDVTIAEHAVQEAIMEKTAMTRLSFSSSLRTDGKIGENDVNNMYTSTLQTSEYMPEKNELVGNQKVATDSRDDADGKVFCSLHENDYKLETDKLTPLVDQKIELSSSLSCHSSRCNRGEVPDITTEDQGDEKAVESMSLQNNYNHDPPLEESCKARESKKTELDLSNGINKDCSYSPQKTTSAFKMTIQDAIREELKSFFQVHPLGLQALTEPSHNMSRQEVSQVNNSPDDIHAENGTFIGTSIMTQEKSEKKNGEIVMGWKIKGKRSDEDKIIHQQSAVESVAQYSDSKNAWESLKARNGSFHNPKPLIIEVKEAEKVAVHHKPLPYDHKKKECLTPIEKPSQILDPDFKVSLKLLHMPPEIYQESKKLSKADLCDDDDASLHSQSVARAVDDTLDDVTLPDSLHVSDLDENYHTHPSQNTVQENIMKGNKFQFSKKNVTGEASSKLNRTVTLKKIFNQKSKQPVRWDQKELLLKSLPVQVKTASATVVHNLGEQITCGAFEPQSFIERNVSVKKTLKLLTLPKQPPQNVETVNDYPPLLLKQLPINKVLEAKSKKNKTLFTVPSKGCSDYLSDKQNSKQRTNFAKKVLLKDTALLTIPTCSYLQVKECRGPDSIRFLDPKQVFNYYAANMIKRKQHRLRSLRINEPPKNKNINEIYEKEVCSNDQTVNKKEIPEFDAQENIDKGFLDRVKGYAEKYKTSAFKEVLVKGNDKTDGTVRSRFQYEATQKMDKVYQSQSQHFQSSKEIQTLPQDVSDFQKCETNEFKDMLIKRTGKIPVSDGSRFQHRATQKMDKLYQSQSQHIQITRETQTLPQDLNEIKEKTFSDHKAVGVQAVPILEKEEKEAENKYGIISFHVDQRSPDNQSLMKLMETRVIKTRDSWTETDLLGSRLNLPHEIHEVQTQTPVRPTKDTSVTAHLTTSYQPQSHEGYSSSHPPSQEGLPATQCTHLSSYYPKPPPAACGTTTFNSGAITLDPFSQPFKETDSTGDIIDIADSPHEAVQQQLEEIQDELNKTKFTLDPETVVQETVPSSSAVMKIERHASTVEEVRNGETENNSGVKRVDGTDRLETDDSSLETYTDDTDFKKYEALRNQNKITRNMERDILQNDFKEILTNTELVKDELDSTTADFALERGFLGSDKIIMNELIEAFSHGRITFEDLCKMSSNVKMAEEEQKLEERHDNDNIDRLEQQTVEAAQSLRETRNLMSKLNHLLQISERLETERVNAQRSTSSDKGFQYSLPAVRTKSSLENLRWQETLSTFKKNSNPDTLLRFIEDTKPEDITNEMIDEIIKFVESIASKHSTCLPLYSQEVSSPHSKTYINKGISRESYEDVKTDRYQRLSWIENDKILRQTDEGSSDRINNQPASDYYLAEMNSKENTCRTEDYLNDSHAMPELHLDLSGLRSGSSNSFPCMSYQSLVRQHSSSLDLNEKRQSRRAEIHTWMKKRRKKQMEQAQAVAQNTITKTQLNTYKNHPDSKRPAENALESMSTVKMENQGLSGKQLRESNQKREERRNLLRQDHWRKREEDVLKLLTDHEEELMSHRNLLVKKQTNKFPQIANSNESLHKSRLLSVKSNDEVAIPSQKQIQAKLKSNRKFLQPSFAKPFKPRVRKKKKISEVETCFTDNVDMLNKEGHSTSIFDDLSSLSISPLSCKVFSDRKRTYVMEKMKMESDSNVQAELDSLVKCLRSSEKDKSLLFCRESGNKPQGSASSSFQMKNNHGKKSEKSRSEQRPFDSEKTISVNVKRQQEKSNSETFYQINSTFTLPLDRISEVDSNVSAASLLNGDSQEKEKESLPRRPNGQEDTSSESSWNVPDDVENLLLG